MAKTPRLKVFRTPVGFHDAYVAAASRAAALRAWGSSADLFARGVAEEVTDPALTAEPLTRPGEVIRRSRGTAAEQFAALPPDPPRREPVAAEPAGDSHIPTRKAAKASRPGPTPPAPSPPKPVMPRPDRGKLDAAEAALTEAEERHRAAERDLAAREAALSRERRDTIAKQTAEHDKLEQARDDARRTYDRALAAWRAA